MILKSQDVQKPRPQMNEEKKTRLLEDPPKVAPLGDAINCNALSGLVSCTSFFVHNRQWPVVFLYLDIE